METIRKNRLIGKLWTIRTNCRQRSVLQNCCEARHGPLFRVLRSYG